MTNPISIAFATCSLVLCAASMAVDRQRFSAPDGAIEAEEAVVALAATMQGNDKLRQEIEASQAAVASLQKSLAIANSESEVFRRQASELRLRVEALGAAGAAAGSETIEQRLLKAVSELKVVEDERKQLQAALIQLSEAVLRYQKVTVTNDPEARLALEAEMRGAARALGVAPPAAMEAVAVTATLTDGMVISLKEELALVVANVGAKHGVKVGMPFQVRRGDDVVGVVRVVDVREKVSGAVIQNLRPDKDRIQVGDRLKVDALQ